MGEVCDGQRSVPSEQTKTHTLIDLHKVEFSPVWLGVWRCSSVFLQIIYFEKNVVLVRGRLRSRLKFGFLVEFPFRALRRSYTIHGGICRVYLINNIIKVLKLAKV